MIIVAVIVADQATKLLAEANLTAGESVEVLGQFFMFTLVHNLGGAMGTNFGSSTYYLVASSLILLFVLYYMWSHRHETAISIPLALIAGGAIGNLIDRARIGQVIDFIDFDFFDISLWGFQLTRWWAFNIADAAITCAIVFLLVHMFFLADRGTPDPANGSGSEDGESDPTQAMI